MELSQTASVPLMVSPIMLSKGTGPPLWLLIEWPKDESEPSKYYLCDLPEGLSRKRLVQIARGRWRVELDYQQMKEELGLDHFEGRSWTGWHHHVTLVMLAHLFLRLGKKRGASKRTRDAAANPAGDPAPGGHLDGSLSLLWGGGTEPLTT